MAGLISTVRKLSLTHVHTHTHTCHQWDNSIQQTMRVNVYSHCMQTEVISVECTNTTLISIEVSGEQSGKTESEIILIHSHTHTHTHRTSLRPLIFSRKIYFILYWRTEGYR